MTNFTYLLRKKNRFGAVCVSAFRIAHFFSTGKLKIFGFPLVLAYRIVFRNIIGFDVHEQCVIGENFCPWHCNGLVISPKAVIGRSVILHHNTTIGEKNGGAPLIEDDVCIAPQCSVVGKIIIGTHSTIGIGSVVIKDVPPNTIVAGNPAKIIRGK